jgi:molybdopterin-guanine dinucleotide biosynthesis protein A
MWSGVLLGGGSSSRMHRNKAILTCPRLGSADLVSHACQQLKSVINNNYFLANSRRGCPTDFKFIADQNPAGGPLQALQEFLPRCETEFLLVMPLDMPLVTSEQLSSVVDYVNLSPATSYFCLNSDGQACFPLVINENNFAELQELTTDKMFDAMRQIGAQALPESVVSAASLININTPQHWREFSEAGND